MSDPLFATSSAKSMIDKVHPSPSQPQQHLLSLPSGASTHKVVAPVCRTGTRCPSSRPQTPCGTAAAPAHSRRSQRRQLPQGWPRERRRRRTLLRRRHRSPRRRPGRHRQAPAGAARRAAGRTRRRPPATPAPAGVPPAAQMRLELQTGLESSSSAPVNHLDSDPAPPHKRSWMSVLLAGGPVCDWTMAIVLKPTKVAQCTLEGHQHSPARPSGPARRCA